MDAQMPNGFRFGQRVGRPDPMTRPRRRIRDVESRARKAEVRCSLVDHNPQVVAVVTHDAVVTRCDEWSYPWPGDQSKYLVCRVTGLVEARNWREDGSRRGIQAVVLVLVLDGRDEPDVSVEASVVEPVDVLRDRDLRVIDRAPRTQVAQELGLKRVVTPLVHRDQAAARAGAAMNGPGCQSS